MERRTWCILVILCSNLVSATTVNLTIDRREVNIGEEIKINLEIDPTEPVGGRLVVYQKENSKYALFKVLYNKPSPDQCHTCAGDVPLREYLSRDFLFIPARGGSYRADANFGGVQTHVDFNVTSPTTTTLTTTTIASSSTTSSTSTTTLALTSTSTSTTFTTTTTLDNGSGNAGGIMHRVLEWILRIFNF